MQTPAYNAIPQRPAVHQTRAAC